MLMDDPRAEMPDGFDERRLNKQAPPFVPDSEGDAPGIWWFTEGWPWEAFRIQQRNGTLLPPEES